MAQERERWAKNQVSKSVVISLLDLYLSDMLIREVSGTTSSDGYYRHVERLGKSKAVY